METVWDATFICANGPDTYIWPAIRDAAKVGNGPVVLLCNGRDKAKALRTVYGTSRLAEIVVVDVSEFAGHPLLDLMHFPSPFATKSETEVGRLRNAGLLIATMMGWQRVIFRDDDIYRAQLELLADQAGAVGKASDGKFMAITTPVDVGDPDRAAVNQVGADYLEVESQVIGGTGLIGVYVPEMDPFNNKYSADLDAVLIAMAEGRYGRLGSAAQYPSFSLDAIGRFKVQELGDFGTSAVMGAAVAAQAEGSVALRNLALERWYRAKFCRVVGLSQMIAEGDRRSVDPNAENFDVDGWYSQARPGLVVARHRLLGLGPRQMRNYYSRYNQRCLRWHKEKKLLPRVRRIADACAQLRVDAQRAEVEVEPSAVEKALDVVHARQRALGRQPHQRNGPVVGTGITRQYGIPLDMLLGSQKRYAHHLNECRGLIESVGRSSEIVLALHSALELLTVEAYSRSVALALGNQNADDREVIARRLFDVRHDGIPWETYLFSAAQCMKAMNVCVGSLRMNTTEGDLSHKELVALLRVALSPQLERDSGLGNISLELRTQLLTALVDGDRSVIPEHAAGVLSQRTDSSPTMSVTRILDVRRSA